MKGEYLKMIGLGTKGLDGIEEGIHLRWSFDDKLGFPPCFKLYRRESDLKNKYEFPIHDDIIPQTVDLPYTYTLHQNDTFKFRLASAIINGEEADSIQVEYETLEDGSTIRMIHIEGELTILFSKPVSRIELRFLLEDHSSFKIKTLSEKGNYYPYSIEENATGLQNISFDAPQATGLVLRGTAIKLVHLAGWICVAKGNWQRINDLCGCGLPVNQEGTNYTDDVYPPFIGRDLATALCRLGYKTVGNSPITAAQFLELKAMLLTMTEEGAGVPVGWTLFPDDEGEVADETLEFSKYDFLLAQSLHVFFAKILDLYFVDTDTDNDKVYDYKVTAEWPEWNKRRLDHEITFDDYPLDETFFLVYPLDDQVVLYAPKPPQIVEEAYPLSRTTMGLDISSENVPIVINFLQPVTEVQIFLVNPDFTAGSQIIVEAYKHLFSAWVDRETLWVERGMLRLRAEQIDYIKIHTSHAVLCRIHYDFEPYPVGLQSYITCGIFKHTHLPLTQPAALTASFLPGGTVTDQEGIITEKPYLAGLRWDVNENPEKEMISIASVLYHIERKAEGGNVTLLTEDSPLFVTPSLLENKDRNIPIGWPRERQYFTEAITLETLNHYRIAAMDLFGRQSTFTNYETYEITTPKPPHPAEVTAQFLDYGTYNSSEDTFSDPTINDDDKDWLRDNRKNAIVVRWKWPENLQLQAPDVEGFTIYFKQGWLNTYTGIVVTDPAEEILTKTSLNLTQKELEKYPIFNESPEDIPVYKFKISLDVYPPPLHEPVPPMSAVREREILPEDAFRLCWLTQGNHSFLILKNDGGPEVSLWALKLEDMPMKDKGFGIAVTPEKEFFINYKNPERWTDNRIRHQEPKDSREDYTVYIEDPEFPNPPIEATDINKVRYAQIGVNSYVGEVEGSVSAPATIMAVYREVPAPPIAFSPIPDEPIQALRATPANVHGKSLFALRWEKTNTGVQYHIFRALDETLFRIDNANRPTRSLSVYEDFKTNFPDFDPADVEVLKDIPHETDPILIGSHYTDLTPGQLQILASLSDNENAFTRINEGAIAENDPLYEDRITEIPDPVHGPAYTPDPAHTLLYADKTLNGQSSNHYFYAIRSVDTNGLQSALSLSTPPVAIPKTTPPPVPVITSMAGGENQISVKWAKNPGATIAGYLLYRTQDTKKAGDWRRMELIKANETDAFTVAVNGNLPAKEFEYIDTSAVARQAYYYGVVAVGLSDEGKWLRSGISKARVGQAYKLTPPDPPVIHHIEWIRIDDDGNEFDFDAAIPAGEIRYPAVKLAWTSQDPELSCLVQFSGDYFEGFQNASEWLAPGDYSFIHKNSHFNFDHSYRIQVMDQFGNKNIDFLEFTLTSKIS